jgi:hypothetical protein
VKGAKVGACLGHWCPAGTAIDGSKSEMNTINVARFDLMSLRLVVLCEETGSLSAATRKSHCTLSAGSQRLTALEETLGCRLFVRDYKGLQITRAGELVVEHGKAILNQLETLSSLMSSSREDGDKVVDRRSLPRAETATASA